MLKNSIHPLPLICKNILYPSNGTCISVFDGTTVWVKFTVREKRIWKQSEYNNQAMVLDFNSSMQIKKDEEKHIYCNLSV